MALGVAPDSETEEAELAAVAGHKRFSAEYIVARDRLMQLFADVTPLKGVMTGGGEHKLTVAVDVIALKDEPELEATGF